MSNDILNQIYTNPTSGVAFSHWKNLLKKAKKIDSNITKEDVLLFLASKPSYTIYAKTVSRHRKRPIKSHFPNDYISIDLLQLSRESIKHNKPTKFILCSSDIFSRKLSLIPISSKSIPDVKKGLEMLFSKLQNIPKKILSDLESSFYSKPIQNYLKSKNIKLFSQQGAANLKTKNGIVERAQRTVRQLIVKTCVEFNTKNFVNYLPYIEKIFNSRINRSTGFDPNTLHSNRSAIATYQEKILQRDQLKDKTLSKFAIGDRVRYKLAHTTFSKEIKKTFSQSIHTVVEIKSTNPANFIIHPPPTHKRILYAQDLIKVLPTNNYQSSENPIEKISDFKILPNGEILFSCILIGFKERVWLTENEIKNRYILFPDSLDYIKKKNNLNNNNISLNTNKNIQILTRSKKKENIQAKQIVTRNAKKKYE